MTLIKDIKVTSGQWVDVYTETTITPQAALIMQNKGSSKVRISISEEEPDIEESEGFTMDSFSNYYSRFDIDEGTGNVWLLSEDSTCSVVVQEV